MQEVDSLIFGQKVYARVLRSNVHNRCFEPSVFWLFLQADCF